jgi:hypothetical protein
MTDKDKALKKSREVLEAIERADLGLDEFINPDFLTLQDLVCSTIDTIKQAQESSNIVGWCILDNKNIPFHFIPKLKNFYGEIVENSYPSSEYISKMDLEWSGMAPFTVKELSF